MPFNLPAALTEIGTDIKGLNQSKAPTSHTHAAAEISDSTAAGRALLTAANAEAQRTALEIELDYLGIYTEARDAV